MKEQHSTLIDDTPIKTIGEDILDRERFVLHLSKALVGWQQSESSESIVIALCGKWGSGKSSIIKLVTSDIDENHNSNKPIIVEFNPWEFSKKGSLVKHFFNEIARKLKAENDSDEDKETNLVKRFFNEIAKKFKINKDAQKLHLYAKQLELFSFPTTSLTNWLRVFSIVLGSGFISQSYTLSDWHEIIFWVIGASFILLGVLKEKIVALANYLEAKREFSSKSASEIKDEIIKQLKNRERKILVIIDDIDRLNQSEIRKVFQLIKINADFPNTIYLLSFDREIVEKNLDVQKGISGKDYMGKIVQMYFDVPVVNHSKIWGYFDEQLERVLNKLPEGTAEKYFSGNDSSQFQRGNLETELKNFIKNIRDVKRFINGLEFNLLQMHMNGHMEVNVIDFIAIEAIRMFAPSFYSFMKQEKTFFTSILNDTQEKKVRIGRVQKALNKVRPEEIKNSISHLIEELFPPIYSDYIALSEIEMSSGRRKELRTCEREFFDKYFTLLPGGGENELSQSEINNILHSANSTESFEKILTKYVKDKRINNAVISIGDFADDEERVPLKNIKNIVKVLFDVSDNLYGNTIKTCYKFLRRENGKDGVLEMLKEIIPHSKGLYWPVMLIYSESEAESKGFGELVVVPEDKIEEMRKMCVTRIQNFDVSSLLKNENLGFIMYRWYYWDKEETWKPFIEKIQKDDEQLLAFVDKFVTEHRQFRESLKVFLNVDDLEEKLKNIKTEDSSLYEKYKRAIDLYLKKSD